MALVAVAGGLAIGAIHLNFYGRWSHRLRKGLGVALAVLGLFVVTNYVLTPEDRARLAEVRAGGAGRGPGPGQAAGHRLHGRLVPALQGAGGAGVQPPGRRQPVPGAVHPAEDRSVTREDEDETLIRLREKYGVQTLPAVRVVTPEGKVASGINSLVGVTEFLDVLARGRACAKDARVC